MKTKLSAMQYRHRLLLTLALALLLVVLIPLATVLAASRSVTPRTPTAPFVSVGFDIGWHQATNPPWADLTQIDLFALQTTNGTGLDTHFLSTVNIPQLITNAHAHGVTVLITIGGISDQNWQNACNATNQAGFISNLVTYMQSKGFDGIDLDIEDDAWSKQGPPSPAMTSCIAAISSAAKAVKTQAGNTPFLSEDVTTPWMGPWVSPSNTAIDQFNLMTYGDTCTPTCATFASDVATTAKQGVPTAKMVLGIDDIDSYPVAGDCGAIANYAQQQSLQGVMTWDIETDAAHNNACFNQFAPYIGGTPQPTPTSTLAPTATPSLTPTATPTGTPTPQGVPCIEEVNGVMTVGTCTGTFQPNS